MCVWLVHRGTFVSTYCMLICVYVFGIIGHWLALLSLHRLWHWAFKEVNKCQLQPTKWNLYWAHPWFTIPALLQRKKKDEGEDRGRSEFQSHSLKKRCVCPSPDSSWQTFQDTTSNYHSSEAKAPALNQFGWSGMCICPAHTNPGLEPSENTPWGPEYYFWRNICYVSVSKGKRMRGWERSKTIGCERSERKKLFCFH